MDSVVIFVINYFSLIAVFSIPVSFEIYAVLPFKR